MRTTFDPDELGRAFYRLLTAVVVPRPIAWISSVSESGVHNLAPHSFFTVACVTPPIVQFTSVGRKDSLRNIEATGEFVVGASRVAASPAALECVLHSTVCLGDSTVVFGRVVMAVVDDDVLDDGHPDIHRLRPLSRLGRDEWGARPQVLEISRIPFRDWPGHYRAR
jgi:flavin reductase (DIM6/NTAB) family NADH-FMN oxidoreductase RutF